MIILTPEFCVLEDHPVPGWRMADQEGNIWSFGDRDCLFASQLDCQLACDSFNAEALTVEQFLTMSDEDMGKLVTKNLRW